MYCQTAKLAYASSNSQAAVDTGGAEVATHKLRGEEGCICVSASNGGDLKTQSPR